MADTESGNARREVTQRGHEPDTVSVCRMAWIGLGLFALMIVTLAGVAMAFTLLVPDAPLVTADDQARRQSMTPGVKPNQAYDRRRIEASERALLRQYGWQDKERGVARIPIERAIELMVQRQLQVQWPKHGQAKPPAPADIPAEKQPQ